MAEPVNLRLGNRLVSSARLKDWKVKDNGETMLLFLDEPREVAKVSGGDNVQRAILEIQRAFEPSDVGWREVGER